MSIEPIKAEVRSLLAQTNYDIHHSERLRANSAAGEERVRAASQLVLLKKRKETLEGRARELALSRDGAFSTFVQWIREDWMLVSQGFESWLSGH